MISSKQQLRTFCTRFCVLVFWQNFFSLPRLPSYPTFNQLRGRPASNTTLWKGRCLVSHLGHSHYANPRNRQHITYNSPFVPKGLCSCGKPQGNASCILQAPPLWVGNCTPVIYHRGLPGLDKRMHNVIASVQPQSCFAS